MPEQFEQPRSIYQNEAQRNAAVAKLGRKITDVVKHKVGGVKTDDPEYWGLKEVLTDEMVDLGNRMKLRQFYDFDQMMTLAPEIEPAHLQELLDEMSVIGILEYDYGDHYNDDGPIADAPRIKRWRLPFCRALQLEQGSHRQESPGRQLLRAYDLYSTGGHHPDGSARR